MAKHWYIFLKIKEKKKERKTKKRKKKEIVLGLRNLLKLLIYNSVCHKEEFYEAR
jgi:hypothetical protein